MRQRDRQKLSCTFHGAGMVVPYDKKTQVGRESAHMEGICKKINMEEVQF
jgi:hypothetical protein